MTFLVSTTDSMVAFVFGSLLGGIYPRIHDASGVSTQTLSLNMVDYKIDSMTCLQNILHCHVLQGGFQGRFYHCM